MDLDDIPQEENKSGFLNYIKQNVLQSLILGFFFGLGHFVAFKLLQLKIFNNIRMIASS